MSYGLKIDRNAASRANANRTRIPPGWIEGKSCTQLKQTALRCTALIKAVQASLPQFFQIHWEPISGFGIAWLIDWPDAFELFDTIREVMGLADVQRDHTP